MDAPVDRLEAAVDKALFKEAVKGLKSVGLVVASHGLIGLLPAAKAADAFELRGLQVDIFLRIGAAGLKDGGHRHGELFVAQLLVDFDLIGRPWQS